MQQSIWKVQLYPFFKLNFIIFHKPLSVYFLTLYKKKYLDIWVEEYLV